MSVLERGEATAPTGRRSAGAPRRIERPSRLPRGRAVVGGLLVGLAAVGTFAAWQGADGEPTTTYAVATRDIGIGERIEAGDITLVSMDLAPPTAGGAFGVEAAPLAIGQITVAPLAEGDLLQRSSIVVADDAEARRQLSFPVDASRALAGTVERGEIVDVVVSYGDGRSTVAVAGAVVADVLGGDLGGGLVVLVSVPADADILEMAGALQAGDVTLVRATGAPALVVGDEAVLDVGAVDGGEDDGELDDGDDSTEDGSAVGG